MVKGPEETLLQRRHTQGQQTHGKVLSITSHQGNANQNHSETPPHTTQEGCHQKDRRRQALVRMRRN